MEMRSTEHSKVKGFLNNLGQAEMHAIPKLCKKWIPVAWEKYGKTEHSKVMSFLNILYEAEIHTISKTWEKWVSIQST